MGKAARGSSAELLLEEQGEVQVLLDTGARPQLDATLDRITWPGAAPPLPPLPPRTLPPLSRLTRIAYPCPTISQQQQPMLAAPRRRMLREEARAVLLLVILYCIQGVPLGLSMGSM